jgi:DNA-binding XRE family transcriptional regulator
MARATLTGTRIRERRTVAGIRQADLARTVGISPAYLNLIEHNSRSPGTELVARIAGALGISPRALDEGVGSDLFEALREAAAGVAGVGRDGTGGEAGGANAPVSNAPVSNAPVSNAPGATPGRAHVPPAPAPEIDRIEEFVTRFPGWAALLAAHRERLAALSRSLEAQAEWMTHDPHLSSALVEIVSAITSVRSTAAILAETEDIEPDWRALFHRNLAADSERLTDAAAALAAYLDSMQEIGEAVTTPQEEVEAWLAPADYRIAALEQPDPPGAAEFVAAEVMAASVGTGWQSAAPGSAGTVTGRTSAEHGGSLATNAARSLAVRHAQLYRRDALALPIDRLSEAVGAVVGDGGPADAGSWADLPDPAGIAARFGVGLAVVLRRLAILPSGPGWPGAGLIRCDGAGAIVFRRPVAGFAMPRFGAGCPLWPLYDALRRPGEPVRAMLGMAGLVPRRFAAYAVAERLGPPGFGAPEVIEAAMLVVPADGLAPAGMRGAAAVDARAVGPACRICTRGACPARREPSILSEGT